MTDQGHQTPPVFVIEDASGEYFAIDGEAGWLALIARYVRFPEPRQTTEGWPVLEPQPPETLASVRSILGHAVLENV